MQVAICHAQVVVALGKIRREIDCCFEFGNCFVDPFEIHQHQAKIAVKMRGGKAQARLPVESGESCLPTAPRGGPRGPSRCSASG